MTLGLGEAASVVTTLKSAVELVQKLRGSDSKEDLQNGIAALTELVINARLSALDLIEEKALLLDERSKLNQRLQELEAKLRRLTDFDEQSEKYERVQTGAGKFVYREKNPAPGAGAPFFCPKCFSDKKESALQGRHGDSYVHCPSCNWGDYLFS